MGAPTARCLPKAGHCVHVSNRSPEKAQKLIADGADVAANPAEAARGAQVVFIMVPDAPGGWVHLCSTDQWAGT